MLRSIGFAWSKRAGINPQIQSSCEVVREPIRRTERIELQTWAMDCAFNSGERFRLNSQAKTWMKRDANVIYLWSPKQRIWQNCEQVGAKRHSTWLCFHWPRAKELRARLHSKLGYARFHDPDASLRGLLQNIAAHSNQTGEQGFWFCQSQLSTVIQLVLQATPIAEGEYTLGNIEEEEVAFEIQVQNYLKAHLREKLELSDIAQAFSCSTSSLSHRYRAACGESPIMTYNRLRLEQAELLLQNGEALKNIADQLGYYDVFHFSKAYKRFRGMSPKQARSE